MQLTFSWKQRKQSVEFSHNTSKSKYIDLLPIASWSEDTLRCSIPSCWYILCVGRRLRDLLNQTKITDFGDESLTISENVIRLQISVEKTIWMNVLNGNTKLIHDVSDLNLIERRIRLSSSSNHLAQISLTQLKYHVYNVLVSDDFFHLDNRWMIELD